MIGYLCDAWLQSRAVQHHELVLEEWAVVRAPKDRWDDDNGDGEGRGGEYDSYQAGRVESGNKSTAEWGERLLLHAIVCVADTRSYQCWRRRP